MAQQARHNDCRWPADADSEFGDLIEDTEAIAVSDEVSASLLRQQFEVALAMLSEREAAVMRMRVGLTDGQPTTLEEIGGSRA